MMPKLRSSKQIILSPVRANAGVEANYHKKLIDLIDEMQKSILYWVSATYKANPPHAALAMDASPAKTMHALMQKLAKRWQRSFNDGAKDMATHFADKSMGSVDIALQNILKKAGFSVSFKMTASANDAYQAVIAENIGLIKSIAAEHLSKAEGVVMRSVQHGRDLSTLRDELMKRGDVTKNRAAFIARDQNNKATALITRVRQKSLGITKAIWLHSGGGVHPRESHEEADGTQYEVETGCQIDGEFIFPGELPNCSCVCKSVIAGFDDEDGE